MRKSLLTVGTCALLGGCALPVPIQVASWAADIISFAATEKSITDHGLSAFFDMDCAMHRAVTDTNSTICREEDDSSGAVLVASADRQRARRGLQDNRTQEEISKFATIEKSVAKRARPADAFEPAPSSADVASFETAAGGVPEHIRRSVQMRAEKPVAVRLNLAQLPLALETEARPFIRFDAVRTAAVTTPVEQPRAYAGSRPNSGFYFVIGSFQSAGRAQRHMQAHSQLTPAVLKGKIGSTGREVYRVVVGPLAQQDRKVTRGKIQRSGIADTWAIRITASEWSIAARIQPMPQTARLSARDWPGLAAMTTEVAALRR